MIFKSRFSNVNETSLSPIESKQFCQWSRLNGYCFPKRLKVPTNLENQCRKITNEKQCNEHIISPTELIINYYKLATALEKDIRKNILNVDYRSYFKKIHIISNEKVSFGFNVLFKNEEHENFENILNNIIDNNNYNNNMFFIFNENQNKIISILESSATLLLPFIKFIYFFLWKLVLINNKNDYDNWLGKNGELNKIINIKSKREELFNICKDYAAWAADENLFSYNLITL